MQVTSAKIFFIYNHFYASRLDVIMKKKIAVNDYAVSKYRVRQKKQDLFS